MKTLAALIGFFMLGLAHAAPACPPLLNHTLKDIDGQPQTLCAYHGKVVLVVNTASNCGYTSQYKGLQALHDKYGKQGLVVLGFPSNDFGGQEPGSNATIKDFCETNYEVSFPLFSKVGVSASHANPLYEALARATGVRPAWNFHKYLIDRSGTRSQSFPSAVDPESREMVQAIESLLKARSGNHKLTQAGR
ncbi:MAG: glutathione peroxidase [Thiobacillus sp.]